MGAVLSMAYMTKQILALTIAGSVCQGTASSSRPFHEKVCQDDRWARLFDGLSEASTNSDFLTDFSPALLELTEYDIFEWYKANYKDCVEGLLSFVLYLSLVMEHRRGPLLELASHAARELNPLALKSGQSAWPFFGLLDKLQLVWQSGQHAAPLLTDPWRLPPLSCPSELPPVLHPFQKSANGSTESLGNLAAAWGWTTSSSADDFSDKSVLRLARNLDPGSVLVDAGVFDGTDWSYMGILAGATVIGFEPLAENRRLVDDRLQLLIEEHFRRQVTSHTMLPIVPGEAVPRTAWETIFKGGSSKGQPGHSYIIGAALGERVRALNMTTRYDYSSIADQGYLSGPPDMQIEQVAMTTLDVIYAGYLSSFETVKLLKLDVEGYEMGSLRGAERLLSEGRVQFLVLEFHPGMLGSSGTDPEGLLEFLRHYCFRCYSLKISKVETFADFVARYVTSAATPLQGLGELEDLVCESLAWRG